MQVGLMAPQGWKGDYDGWPPADAWARTVELARQAEELGFESLWVFDHFHTVPEPTDEITFESFSVLAALAMVTERVRLGHMVVCTGFRNPALTAKLSSTIDVISGGRFELGIGAGWKEDEWVAYGYGFPPLADRMAAFGDHLEIITRMLQPGRSSYEGRYAHVRGAINEPQGLQTPRIPIIVGGNGRQRTAGYAIRFAEELNFVFIEADDIVGRMRDVRERCEAEGRDPATMRFSLYERDERMRDAGQARVDRLARFAEIGLDRLVAFPTRWSPTLDCPGGLRRGLCRRRDQPVGAGGGGRPLELLERPRDRGRIGGTRVRHADHQLPVAHEHEVLIDRRRRGLARRFDVVTEVERLAGREGDPLRRDLTLGQGLELSQVGLLEQVQAHAHARKRQDVEVGPGRDIRPEGEDHETTREHGLDLRGIELGHLGVVGPRGGHDLLEIARLQVDPGPACRQCDREALLGDLDAAGRGEARSG